MMDGVRVNKGGEALFRLAAIMTSTFARRALPLGDDLCDDVNPVLPPYVPVLWAE